ncbi:hypothetical protein [Paenibacillus sp. FSL R5-0810]|uniref:hypothetical protein n=1 Tax=Paenibacillus sp. FSL R5-0810 TaxID=2921659 RepID=UPI0030FBA9D8
MRDENNRNTLPELIYLEYETKRKIDETDMIPEDDIRDVNTYTTQSLSSEEADHSGYDQNESAPADAKPPAAVINPDHSALDAWEAAGAEPDNRTIAGEPASGSSADAIDGQELKAEGRLPLDQASANAAFVHRDEREAREWLDMEGEPPTRPGDEVIAEYAGDAERRVTADAAFSGSGTAFLGQGQDLFITDSAGDDEDYTPLQDVPDADAIAADSPVDPAAPQTDLMHGTDLLNGSNGEED